MKNLQIPEVQSLGQVLTLDEMKSICGGIHEYWKCVCTLTIQHGKNGIPVFIEADPSGSSWKSREMCTAGCQAKCASTDECKHVETLFEHEESTCGSN